MSTSSPRRCSRRFSACTRTDTVSVTRIGRYWVMWFSMCTEPSAATGKSKPVTSDITVGNVSAKGYVRGTASPNRSRVTFAYAATFAGSMASSSTVIVRSGSVSPRRTNGSAPAAARTMFVNPDGCVMLLSLGAQHGLATHPDGVTGDGVRRRAGEIGDGLGDVDGLTALIQRVQPPPHLTGGQRDGLGHLRLDEPRRDGVDRHALVRQHRRQCLGQTDHARLGGRVVGLPAVAGDARHRRQPDDPAALAEGAVVHQALGEPKRRKQVHGADGIPAALVHPGQPLVPADPYLIPNAAALPPVSLPHLPAALSRH